MTERIQETGPTVHRPYPRRLESPTYYRCHGKGSTFSSVIVRYCQLLQALIEMFFDPVKLSDIPLFLMV